MNYSTAFQLWRWGMILSPQGQLAMSRDIFIVITWQGMGGCILLAARWCILSTYNTQDHPSQKRILLPKMSIMLKLRNVFLIDSIMCFLIQSDNLCLLIGVWIIYFFFFFFGCWVFVAARRFSLVAARGGFSSLRCTGFSLPWFLLLQSTGFRCAGFSSCSARALGLMGFSSCGSRALELRLSSCGSRAQLLRGMWDLPGPGIQPVSPALAGKFLTTVPPGKSLNHLHLMYLLT